jgi:hypothetical protein
MARDFQTPNFSPESFRGDALPLKTLAHEKDKH